MKKIKVIGFDMDYTIVRYYSKHFEQATYDITIDKLIKDFGYPRDLRKFKFNFNLAIRGLVLDRELGNVIKVSRFGKVKQSFHGTKEQDYESLQMHYRGLAVDLASDRYVTIDTSFSIAHAALFSQMVDYMDSHSKKIKKSYGEVEKDIKAAIDIAHRDNTLKSEVINNLKKFIIKDPDTVTVLERFKRAGKKIWIITNSDFEYTKVMLDYTINPYLKDHEDWKDLFELVITSAQKPRFFTDSPELFKIDPDTGYMKSFFGPIEPGCYHGGNATLLQEEFNYTGEDILYIGDHIYGDIVTLKRACNWRTALVVEELANERVALEKSREKNNNIKEKMIKKVEIEKKIDDLLLKLNVLRRKGKGNSDKKFSELKTKRSDLITQIKKVDRDLTKDIRAFRNFYNSRWGETMRAGAEASRLASQIEKYSCIYMSKVSDFLNENPHRYYRPIRSLLPHEIDIV